MILVTGASGFIGSEVRRLAGAARIPLRAISRRHVHVECGDSWLLPGLAPGDVPTHLFADVDCVLHCAAIAHQDLQTSGGGLATLHAANVEAPVALAETAAAAGVKRFIFVSSIKAVADTSAFVPLAPEAPLNPVDAYGRSKAAAERGLRAVASRTGLELAIVRPPLVYGPGVKGNLARLMSRVKAAGLWPFAWVDNRRSLVSVEALSDLLLTVATNKRPVDGIWHASDRRPTSTPELLSAIAEGLQCRLRLVPLPTLPLRLGATLMGLGPTISRLTGSLEMDASATVTQFGWAQIGDSRPGLVQMARAYR